MSGGNADGAAVKVRARARLVKWDGDPPPDYETVDPIGHPQVAEVLEFGDDLLLTVIYRRETTCP